MRVNTLYFIHDLPERPSKKQQHTILLALLIRLKTEICIIIIFIYFSTSQYAPESYYLKIFSPAA